MTGRLRDETGLGLPVAMGVMLVVMILAALTVSQSDQIHRASEHDRGAKRALGPADAGVQRAAWRLAQTPVVTAGQCVVSSASGDSVVAALPGGACPAPVATAMGNGSSYTYVVSPELAAGATCAGETVAAGTYTRCVTATGTAAGVTRRVQTRLRAQAVPLFPPQGVVGRTSVEFNNSIYFETCPGDVPGIIGTNGQLTTTNSVGFNTSCGGNAQSWSHSLAPGAPAPSWGNSTTPNPVPSIPRTQPWTLPAIAPWPATNNNAAIAGGGGVSWNAGTRTLSLTGTLTLAAGTYDFCRVTLGNNGRIALAAGAQVKIYVDSPTRTGSTCAAGGGFLRAENSNGINFPNGNDAVRTAAARNLHVYVWGNPALEGGPTQCGDGQAYGSVTMCHAAGMTGVLYAPNSRVYLGQSIEYVGAIAADRVFFNNSVTFRFPSGLHDGTAGAAGTYTPERWTECRSTATGTAC